VYSGERFDQTYLLIFAIWCIPELEALLFAGMASRSPGKHGRMCAIFGVLHVSQFVTFFASVMFTMQKQKAHL